VKTSVKIAVAIVSGFSFAIPATAQSSAPAAPAQTAKPADPMSEVVCQKQEVVGSRLATRRVCMTRQQWLEQRTMDRQDVEHSQIHPDVQKPGG
jgi:invasion protein IalB